MLRPVEGEENVVDIYRHEGTVAQEGDQWSPETMTEMEGRVSKAVSELNTKIDDDLAAAKSTLNTAIATKAPTNHASPSTTYGMSSVLNYGHSRASSAAPLMNGTAAVGTDNGMYAREGHIHPTDTTRAQPSRKFTVTISNSDWSAVTDSGQTVYRKATGVTGSASDLPILGLPPGQISQLTSSPSLVNDNGTIYIYSAQIPNISLTATVILAETR